MNVDQRQYIEIWKHGNGIMGRRVSGNTCSAPAYGKKIRDVVTQLQPKGEPELQVIRVAPPGDSDGWSNYAGRSLQQG